MFLPIVRNFWLKRMYHLFWGHEMLAGAEAIIATAEQERDELIGGEVTREKIVLRRNGVEVPTTFPERGLFRRELRIPADAQLILFLGRLSQKKSPDLLLKAFAGLGSPDAAGASAVHLAYVGPDEAGMRDRLKQMAEQLGVSNRVHLSAPLEGQAKWGAYRDADVFVLPSQNENFGNTAAEAVAAGTPVVVTKECGIAPLLEDVAGLVVEHKEEKVREALSRLLEDKPLGRKLRNGCVQTAKKLDWEEPLAQTELIYERLAGQSRS
jgi:glycosyltransferase involved in cell wall biosynthesis